MHSGKQRSQRIRRNGKSEELLNEWNWNAELRVVLNLNVTTISELSAKWLIVWWKQLVAKNAWSAKSGTIHGSLTRNLQPITTTATGRTRLATITSLKLIIVIIAFIIKGIRAISSIACIKSARINDVEIQTTWEY